MKTRVLIAIGVAALLLAALPSSLTQAGTPSGRFNLLVFRVDFPDTPGAQFSQATFESAWVGDVEQYFRDMSGNTLDFRPFVAPSVVTMARNRRFYINCPNPALGTESAVCQVDRRGPEDEAIDSLVLAGIIEERPEGLAPAGGTAEDVFDGFLMVFTNPKPYPDVGDGTICGDVGDFAWQERLWDRTRFRERPGLYYAARVNEDGHTPLTGPQVCNGIYEYEDLVDVMQEVGHSLSAWAGNTYDHPAGYVNKFEAMDAGAGAVTGAYTRMSVSRKGSSFKSWFPGWIPDARVEVFDPPTDGTIVLAPIESDVNGGGAPMAARIGTADGSIHVLECRRPIGWDARQGIPDDGVLIVTGVAGRNPGETVYRIPPDGSTPTDLGDPGLLRLWKPGETFVDAANDVSVSIGPDVGGGCTVTVDYGPTASETVPDVGIIPWMTPPLATWETVDLWVDSSCNGYEDSGGLLRYGRSPSGDVVGNGDDLCANRENRIYARVRNFGTREATNVTVNFAVNSPPGVGMRSPEGWAPIGTAPTIPAIGPGSSAIVYVTWTPPVVPPPGVSTGRFPYHTCIQVTIDTVSGERVTANQDGINEQENVGWYEAVFDPLTLAYGPIDRSFNLTNATNEDGWYTLREDFMLPTGWTLTIADGQRFFWIPAGHFVPIAVHVQPPPSAPLDMQFFANVRGYAVESSSLPGTPLSDHLHEVGGVLLAAQTVRKTQLDLSAEASPVNSCTLTGIKSQGCLVPAVSGAILTAEYVSPTGARTSRLVTTLPGGCFYDVFPSTETGDWEVQVFWTGDAGQASIEASANVEAYSANDRDCDTIPNPQDNCPTVTNPTQKDIDQDSAGDVCDCAPQDPGTFAQPEWVTGISVLPNQQGDDFASLSWDSLASQAGSGVGYDVVVGDLALMHTPTRFTDATCVLNVHVGTSATVFSPAPIPGKASFYLLRGHNSCGVGPYSELVTGQVGDRDAAIQQAPNRCAP
jgi:hypothetical protein